MRIELHVEVGQFVSKPVFWVNRMHPCFCHTQEKDLPSSCLGFLVSAYIKTIVISYPCIRCTPTFGVQFWGKKVCPTHGWIR